MGHPCMLIYGTVPATAGTAPAVYVYVGGFSSTHECYDQNHGTDTASVGLDSKGMHRGVEHAGKRA
ncbi:hypothetical protein EV715DRAFT_298297 [Schizophyllum commune]